MVYGSPSAIADGRPARLVCEGVFEKHTEAGNGDIKKVAVEAVYPSLKRQRKRNTIFLSCPLSSGFALRTMLFNEDGGKLLLCRFFPCFLESLLHQKEKLDELALPVLCQ